MTNAELFAFAKFTFNCDLDLFHSLLFPDFCDEVSKGYVQDKFKMFTANPARLIVELDDHRLSKLTATIRTDGVDKSEDVRIKQLSSLAECYKKGIRDIWNMCGTNAPIELIEDACRRLLLYGNDVAHARGTDDCAWDCTKVPKNCDDCETSIRGPEGERGSGGPAYTPSDYTRFVVEFKNGNQRQYAATCKEHIKHYEFDDLIYLAVESRGPAVCRICGSTMVRKTSPKTKGVFLTCPRYPGCKGDTLSLIECEEEETF